jgi:hypothetical protein
MKKLTAGDPETISPDLLAANLERLKALFPELVTEGPDGPAVNVDVLKALVGDKTLTDSDENTASIGMANAKPGSLRSHHQRARSAHALKRVWNGKPRRT